MTPINSATQLPKVTLRTILVVTASVLLAILATAVFSGGAVMAFDITPDPMLPAWHW